MNIHPHIYTISVFDMCLHAETAFASLTIDPALLLMIVGIMMFFITFCGCVGSLRENICLLQTVSRRANEIQHDEQNAV